MPYARGSNKWKKLTKHQRRVRAFSKSNLGMIMFPPRFFDNDKHFTFTNTNSNVSWFFTMNVDNTAAAAEMKTSACLCHGTYARYLLLRRAMAASSAVDATFDLTDMVMWSKSVTNHTVYNPNTFCIQLDVYEWVPLITGESSISGVLKDASDALGTVTTFPAATALVTRASTSTLVTNVEASSISTWEVDRSFTFKSVMPELKSLWKLKRHKSTSLKPNQYITYFQKSFYGMVTGGEFGSPTERWTEKFSQVIFKVSTPLSVSITATSPEMGYSNATIGYRVMTNDIMRELPSGQTTHEVYKLLAPTDTNPLYAPDLAVFGTATTSAHIPHEGGFRTVVNLGDIAAT